VNTTVHSSFVCLFVLTIAGVTACGAKPADSANDEGSGGDGAGGGTHSAECEDTSRFATGSPDHEFGTGQDDNQADFPDPILGPPLGGGEGAGSLDVVSLGNGGWVTLEFGDNAILDEDGADFIVFENPFYFGGSTENVFAELATVSVSEDGENWEEFPCTAEEAPYGACAGWHPVYANAEENEIDPLNPKKAGGDAYDLADVGLDSARYVKIEDRADIEGQHGVFDLDAVSIVHARCP
jgi:hypothetical protein